MSTVNDFFLFTYSVDNIGTSSLSETRTDRVRDKIASIKNDEHFKLYDGHLSAPFHSWSKIENIETTFKGWMEIEGVSDSQKQKDAIKKFSDFLQSILTENNATSSNTIIHCAVMTESLGDTFEFNVVDNKVTVL